MKDHKLENRMESFFLAETTKYLYLLFDQDNFIHNTGDHGTVIGTTNGECVIDTGDGVHLVVVWFFAGLFALTERKNDAFCIVLSSKCF